MQRKKVLSIGASSATMLVQDTTANELRVLIRFNVSGWEEEDSQCAADLYRVVHRAQQPDSVLGRCTLPIYSIAVQNAFINVVCCYAPRGSLHAFLLSALCALPPSQCVSWALDIAQGLLAVHALGFPHCHITSGNVFLQEDGHVRLGLPKPKKIFLAKYESDKSAKDSDPEFAERYPPELLNNNIFLDAASDTWALGRLFQEMCGTATKDSRVFSVGCALCVEDADQRIGVQKAIELLEQVVSSPLRTTVSGTAMSDGSSRYGDAHAAWKQRAEEQFEELQSLQKSSAKKSSAKPQLSEPTTSEMPSSPQSPGSATHARGRNSTATQLFASRGGRGAPRPKNTISNQMEDPEQMRRREGAERERACRMEKKEMERMANEQRLKAHREHLRNLRHAHSSIRSEDLAATWGGAKTDGIQIFVKKGNENSVLSSRDIEKAQGEQKQRESTHEPPVARINDAVEPDASDDSETVQRETSPPLNEKLQESANAPMPAMSQQARIEPVSTHEPIELPYAAAPRPTRRDRKNYSGVYERVPGVVAQPTAGDDGPSGT